MTLDHDFPNAGDETPAPRGRDIMLTSIEFDRPAKCRSCNARVFWAKTQKNGRPILLNSNARQVARQLAGIGWSISSDHVHFATCPHSAQHRRDRRTAPSERID